MPQRDTTGFGERVPLALIDADFSVAFRMVEMAEEESGRGNAQLSSQLLQNARRTLNDIRERLLRMTASQKEPFDRRCEELDQAIKSAET
jgi:hypothetical protein